jgi:hypothetical protein
MAIRGSCLCGVVSYEITGSFKVIGHCHCSTCGKSHGAAFATWGLSTRTNSDAHQAWNLSRRTNPPLCFCKKCAYSLVSTHSGKVTEVVLGTVDGDPGARPGEHIFVGSKAPWYEIVDALPQFEGWPPGMKP